MIEKIRGAVARGWCSKENSHKEMDSTLAEAISQEVVKFIKTLEQENKELREVIQQIELLSDNFSHFGNLEDSETNLSQIHEKTKYILNKYGVK